MIYAYSTCKYFVASSIPTVDPNTKSLCKMYSAFREQKILIKYDFDSEKYGTVP
jgi:hypothetical protein